MMKKYFPFFLLLSFILFSNIISAQIPGNPFVDAGPDQNVSCTDPCTDITAFFLPIGKTTTYTVSSIFYNPPFPFSGLANSLNPDIDDAWSVVDNLPFDFCFFGGAQTLFQVGSNGVIRFDVDPADTSNGWSFDENLPNNSNETLGEANVFTPGHDIDPSVGNTEEIAYEVIGTAPNRVLAVAYFNVPYFFCNDLKATHMAVFYETTNIIDIYIKDKPVCNSWNFGNAVVGIQNNAGTIAFVPPGRQTSDSPWTTNNEAWRFTPAGPSVIVFDWLDELGNVVGTTPTLNVCPSVTSTYTARVTYTNCNNEQVIVTDDVIINVNASFNINLGQDITTCDSSPIVLDSGISDPTFNIQWFLNGSPIAGATNSTYTVNAPNSGNYSVQVTDGGGCTASDSIIITFNPQPVITSPAIDLFQCDNGTNTGIFDLTVNTPIVLGGQDPVEFSVSYYTTLANSQSGNNPITTPAAFPIVGSNQTIYLRIEDSSGNCFALDDFLIIFSAVIVGPMTDETFCDDNQDGMLLVNLFALKNTEALGGQSAANFTVSYHTSQANADNGIDLPNPYNVTGPTETIFVRVESISSPDCYATDSFDINILPLPIANQPDDITICDDGSSNGIFDLTVNTAVVLGSQDPAKFIVTYYTTFMNSQTGNNPINPENAYPIVGNSQTIYVRISDLSNTCYDLEEFQIKYGTVTIGNLTDEAFCDDSGNNTLAIDLHALKDTQVLNGQNAGNYTVTFYNSQAAADAGTPVLPNPYTVTGPSEVIFVRVENNALTGCYETGSFTIFIEVSPVVNSNVDPLLICDLDNDGIATFFLHSADSAITNEPNVTITYHSTMEDANAGINILPEPYDNVVPYDDVVYARVISNNGSCFSVVELVLQVRDSPMIPELTPISICEVNTDNLAIFDLTSKIPEILNGQNPMAFTIKFYESAADATADVNAIQNPDAYQNISNPQNIYVNVRDNESMCYAVAVQSFVIEVREGATANSPAEPYVICDNDGENDGFAGFDLTDPALVGEILGNQNNPPYVVTFYETLENATTATDALISPYTNISNPQIIYARVTNSNTGCFDIAEITIQVDLLPLFTLEDNYRLCVDENGDPIMEEEGDPSPPVIDTGLNASQYTFVWELDGNVLINETGPSIAPTEGGVYTVTVTNITTGCSLSVSTTVSVSSPPFEYDAVVSNAFADQQTITVTASGLGTYIFQLDDGSFQESGIFDNVLPGTHMVTIKDANGCGSVTIEVNLIDYPKFFTPNQDGYHDTWNIPGLGTFDPTSKIYIFDRFGKLLKQLSPLGTGWDGIYNGNPLPSSDYWFRVEYKEDATPKEFKGHFTLKR